MARFGADCDNGAVLTQNRPAAVLWDFDGTVADTEPLWIASQIEVMASYQVSYSYQQAAALCGVSSEVSIQSLFDAYEQQRGERPQFSGDELWGQVLDGVIRRLNQEPLPWRPGAKELLDELGHEGVPMALVSASERRMIDAALAKMPHGIFEVVIAGNEMPKSKPAPDSYLLAAERLSVRAGDCIVVEDSIYGTEAGRAAGAAVIAVPCMQELGNYPGQIVIPSLAGVDLGRLREIWHETKEVVYE